MLKLATANLDGSKIHASASRHSALSYEHINKLEEQLRQEVQQLLIQVELNCTEFELTRRSWTNLKGIR